MFATDDEDGDFLSPTGGAKLASLFGMDQATTQGNESFQYTAPKQPKKGSAGSGPPGGKSTAPPGAPAVLFATAVSAFQYVNGQYVKQGKLGAAVLGHHASREYKILLYVSQQKQVTSTRIHAGFVFTVQPSNYGTFYDDQRQNWSLMFESEKEAVGFCKQVCLAKANSAPSLDSVVTQELVLGEGQRVEVGDTLEVAYSGWLLQNHAVGQMFDSNLNKDKLLRLKLGAGKVIKGWEEGMLGMRKGGRRLLVVPPGQAYGPQGIPNRIPGNSTLIFETEIRRVKFAKDSGLDRVSTGSRDSAAPSPAPSVDSTGPDAPAQPPGAVAAKPGDVPLRAKSSSLNEQLGNPDSTKAKLISRMAKMGQPMLPFLTGTLPSQPDSSDSEMEDHSGSRGREHPPAPSPQPVQMSATPPVSAQGVPAPSTSVLPVSMTTANQHLGPAGPVHAFQPYSYSQSTAATSQLQPVSQMYTTQTMPYQGPSDITSFLMTEARQHNTEIRLAVGKVADKVDQLASKVDNLQKQGGVSLGLSNVSMETAMIMHNIQRIIQENECLKKEVFEKSSKIEEQNRKIGELINQNQRYMEQSNLLMEQRNDSMKSSSEQSQARMLQAELDKVRLTEDLASSAARVSQLQLEASSQQQKATELQAKLSAALQDGERHCTRLAALESQVEELKEQAERAQAQYRGEKQKRREVELKLGSVEEELQDLRVEKESLERALADRKRKWQAERQRCDTELEEARRSSQQEVENLKAQLRRARSSTDQAAAEQLAQLQAELQVEWEARCERELASARERHGRERAELQEQKEALEEKLAQLQEKFSALKLSRESEEQRLLQQQEQGEELQALRQKNSDLQEQAGAVKRQLESHIADLERRLAEQSQADTAAEVKRVMNGVFHSLRGEFDLQESYTGSAVLGVIVSTIKRVTLQLLTEASQKSENDEEEEDEEEEAGPGEEKQSQEVQPNGKEEEVEEEKPALRENSVQTHVGHQTRERVGQQEVGQQEVTTAENQELGQQEVSQQEVTTAEKQEVSQQEVSQQEVTTAEKQEVGLQEVSQLEVTTAEKQEVGQQEVTTSKKQEMKGDPKRELALDVRPAEMAFAQSTVDNHPEAGAANHVRPLSSNLEAEAQAEVVDLGVDGGGPQGEPQVTESAPTGPPTRPPPDPLQGEMGDSASLPEKVEEENGAGPFFQKTAPTKPPPPPTEEEDDELSLKGRPPPAPLFGDDDDDDDDLDWLG
ncbi:FK506-binding protein 15-like isoform X2 [Brienomyrus brachyistius]|uniref:FK506-binding protein 15-like isoform X2 n=1 Tax=Brienomyrus brachyistius TaxID=42636 RepID=UPI0020B1FA09|nr:FK506-binding protein 15-like isoform X2 [Brienomyrus brachyistius]